MKVTMIPIVVGVFEIVTKSLIKRFQELEIRWRVETIKTTELLGSNRIFSSGSQPANAVMKNSYSIIIIIKKKQLCGYFKRKTNEISHEMWTWVRKRKFKYKTRHDWVGKVIHREFRKKFKFDHIAKW